MGTYVGCYFFNGLLWLLDSVKLDAETGPRIRNRERSGRRDIRDDRPPACEVGGRFDDVRAVGRRNNGESKLVTREFNRIRQYCRRGCRGQHGHCSNHPGRKS